MNVENNSSFESEFVKIAGHFAARFSLSPIIGQIYGLLFISPEPVSLNDIVKKTGISKGSASINVRILESWGAVKKVWVDNSRRDYYEANPDTLDIIFRRIKEGLTKRLSESEEKLIELEKKYGKVQNSETETNNEFYMKRMKLAKEMYMQVTEFIKNFS